MIIVFFSNFINHHNIGISDCLYELTSGNFYYVCTHMIPDSFIKSGYPNYFDRPYVVKAFEKSGQQKAKELSILADVALFGGNQELNEYRIPRLKLDKITFECGERWLKKGVINLFSPQLVCMQFYYHFFFRKCSNYYALNASAYGARDYHFLHSFKGRCYKWGYFTKVEDCDIKGKEFLGTRMMWVNRFIGWKHPEMPIFLAKKLKDEGYSFTIDMYGNGELQEKMIGLSKQLNVDDFVHFKGSLPNKDILKEMWEHDIVITTSNQNEGWGAVVNEAMSNGCVLIGSDKVGAVPFLVKDGINGLIYKSNNLKSLLDSVKKVIGQPSKCQELATNAFTTMRDIWSPTNAATNFYKLAESLCNNIQSDIKEGPCSPDIY